MAAIFSDYSTKFTQWFADIDNISAYDGFEQVPEYLEVFEISHLQHGPMMQSGLCETPWTLMIISRSTLHNLFRGNDLKPLPFRFLPADTMLTELKFAAKTKWQGKSQ